MTVRQALAFAALAAALCAGLAAGRVEQHGAAFFVLFGSAAVTFGLVLAGVSAARPLSPALRSLLLGVALAALPLAKLAATLKAVTHHRPLGAVTFAALALVLCAASITVVARLWAIPSQSSAVRVLRVVVLTLAIAGPSLLLLRAAASLELRDGVVDLAIGLGAGALLARVPWPPAAKRAIEAGAIPLWLGALLVGVGSALAFGVGPAEQSSPALAASLSWIFR